MANKNLSLKKLNRLIGHKVYLLRLSKGLSRKQLGEVINVSDHQLQKYEQGINKISAGRLLLIAQALGENINYFYAQLDTIPDSFTKTTKHQRMCLAMSRNFMKINNPAHQTAVNVLIKSLL